jgi:hypothetical protein
VSYSGLDQFNGVALIHKSVLREVAEKRSTTQFGAIAIAVFENFS